MSSLIITDIDLISDIYSSIFQCQRRVFI